MLPVDAGILSQQADDWTDRSVERGTVGPLAAEHALWHNCLFRNVTFTDCRLHSAQLSDIRFEGCDLSNLALDGAALNRVEFVGCKLLGAALPDATLSHEGEPPVTGTRAATSTCRAAACGRYASRSAT